MYAEKFEIRSFNEKIDEEKKCKVAETVIRKYKDVTHKFSIIKIRF